MTVHKNHVRPSQTTEMVILPSTGPRKDPPELAGVDEPDLLAIQDPSEEGEVMHGAEAARFDPMELPISIRKPFRHKPRVLGSDFVAR